MFKIVDKGIAFEMPFDEETFKAVFKCFWERVFTICHHYTADRDDAADLTQMIFLDLWKNRMNLDTDSNLEHYLSKAARYQSFAYLRNKSTRQKHIKILTPKSEQQADANPHTIMETADTQAWLNEVIAQLPEPSKTVFMLNRFEHLSYREIAAKRNITEHTVQYHISKSLHFIKKKLSNIGYQW